MPLRLRYLRPEASIALVGRVFECPDDRPTLIGRVPPADLIFPEVALCVARRHVVIERDEAGWTVRDAGSPGGYDLNHERCGEPPRALSDGDLLRIGQIVFRVHIDGK